MHFQKYPNLEGCGNLKEMGRSIYLILREVNTLFPFKYRIFLVEFPVGVYWAIHSVLGVWMYFWKHTFMPFGLKACEAASGSCNTIYTRPRSTAPQPVGISCESVLRGGRKKMTEEKLPEHKFLFHGLFLPHNAVQLATYAVLFCKFPL